jgi:hypothetical protein
MRGGERDVGSPTTCLQPSAGAAGLGRRWREGEWVEKGVAERGRGERREVFVMLFIQFLSPDDSTELQTQICNAFKSSVAQLQGTPSQISSLKMINLSMVIMTV